MQVWNGYSVRNKLGWVSSGDHRTTPMWENIPENVTGPAESPAVAVETVLSLKKLKGNWRQRERSNLTAHHT